MKPARKSAVIDIGSNSCRLVIYECQGQSILPCFNEKTMAGLGRGLSETGCLSPDGWRLALETMRRFRAILDGLEVSEARAVATAAVREARDGPEFCKQVESILRFEVNVLDGVEEGYLAAKGVAYGTGETSGLVADLGGTSMELHTLSGDQPTGETFALGPLACAALKSASRTEQQAHINRQLARSDLIDTTGPLYLVGGGWRNLARVHMQLMDYPLSVVHAYCLTLADIRFVRKQLKLAEQDLNLQQIIQRVAKKRYDTLFHACLVLETLLARRSDQTAIVSAYGLRDGVIAQSLSGDGHDRLLDAVRHQFHLTEQLSQFGEKVFEFAEIILPYIKQARPVIEAVCLMVEAGSKLHPDHRADLVFETILRAPLPGLTHESRFFAAFAMASRHTYKYQMAPPLQSAIGKPILAQARLLGTLMRLAAVYSGRSAELLATARLKQSGQKLILEIRDDHTNLVSATMHRRLTQLASLMDLEPAILYTSEKG